jgi:hypothetical protein
MDNYGHRLSDFLTLWQQAKKDFPTLTESDQAFSLPATHYKFTRL